MSSYAGEKVTLRCPKCKGSTLELTEIIEEHVTYSVEDGVMPDKADDHQPGSSLGLYATCRKCKHMWTPRARTLGHVIAD